MGEAETLAERFENRYCCAEPHRLRGVFLAAMGAEESKIEASFQAFIRTAKEQKSVSLQKRAEGSFNFGLLSTHSRQKYTAKPVQFGTAIAVFKSFSQYHL